MPDKDRPKPPSGGSGLLGLGIEPLYGEPELDALPEDLAIEADFSLGFIP
jgi:hypothetical protein